MTPSIFRLYINEDEDKKSKIISNKCVFSKNKYAGFGNVLYIFVLPAVLSIGDKHDKKYDFFT